MHSLPCYGRRWLEDPLGVDERGNGAPRCCESCSLKKIQCVIKEFLR